MCVCVCCAVQVPKTNPLPTASAYVTVRHNVVKEDDTMLRFLPYFGEHDATGIDTSVYSDLDEDSDIEGEQV